MNVVNLLTNYDGFDGNDITAQAVFFQIIKTDNKSKFSFRIFIEQLIQSYNHKEIDKVATISHKRMIKQMPTDF